MPTARSIVSAAAASNGKIYTIGGYDGSSHLATVEEYDPATDTWTTRAPLPTPQSGEEIAAATNGKIYVIGGYNGSSYSTTVQEYDPATDTWIIRASMSVPRRPAVAVASNGKIYAIGGYKDIGWPVPLSTVEEYDPATDTWTTRAPMPTARSGLGVAAASNGKIYAIGGHKYSGWLPIFLSTVEEYDPATDTWTTRASMPRARDSLGVVAASNGKIYAIGGTTSSASGVAIVEEYDPATNTWTTMASMTTGRESLGVTATANGKLYAIGGQQGRLDPTYLNTVEEGTLQ
jgi:N-acetylneuraminic acid mutarotase